MRVALLFLIVAALAGCGPSESEKAAREFIGAAARSDFSQGVDVDTLIDALRLCATRKSRDCIEVKAKAQAIADAVASCVGNNSALCKAVLNTKSLRQFKGGVAAPLPTNPFYWSLGNELLDARAAAFSYRREMWYDWLNSWRVVLLSVFVAIFAALGGWEWWSWLKATAAEQAQAEAARKTQEARQRAAQEHAKADADRRVQEAIRAIAEAQARAEAQQQQEEAAKAAAEAQRAAEETARAEAKRIKEATAAALAAAFGKPKPKPKPKR